MNMKKIYLKMMAVLAIMSMACISCSENDPFSTITPEDYPMILDPVFPDWTNGEPSVVSQINRDANFVMNLTVTPSDYTEVSWIIDGVEVQTGNSIDIALEAGTYNLKVVATTTAGLSTSREGKIVVSALQGDPWSSNVGNERIVSQGSTARLYGDNLTLVEKVLIGGINTPVVGRGTSDLGSYIEYVVPTELSDGQYRISLVDVEGNKYGANLTDVYNEPVIIEGFARATSGEEWTMKGIGLDKISTLEINGEITLNEFVKQTYDEIVFVCPDMSEGEYTLKGVSDSGAEIKFYSSQEMVSEVKFIVSFETVLWEGHHYVSWDLSDGDPNKTFNLIPLETFDKMYPGTKMYIDYSIKPEDEYHQLRLTTISWDPYFTDPIDVSEAGTYEFELTQDVLNSIKEKGGFICVGHGYYVDRVTIK